MSKHLSSRHLTILLDDTGDGMLDLPLSSYQGANAGSSLFDSYKKFASTAISYFIECAKALKHDWGMNFTTSSGKTMWIDTNSSDFKPFIDSLKVEAGANTVCQITNDIAHANKLNNAYATTFYHNDVLIVLSKGECSDGYKINSLDYDYKTTNVYGVGLPEYDHTDIHKLAIKIPQSTFLDIKNPMELERFDQDMRWFNWGKIKIPNVMKFAKHFVTSIVKHPSALPGVTSLKQHQDFATKYPSYLWPKSDPLAFMISHLQKLGGELPLTHSELAGKLDEAESGYYIGQGIDELALALLPICQNTALSFLGSASALGAMCYLNYPELS